LKYTLNYFGDDILFFKKFRSFYHKCKAAALIKERIDLRRGTLIEIDNSGEFSREVISMAWDNYPTVFSGSYCIFPHKISSAAFALSLAVKSYPYEDKRFLCALFALSDILNEVDQHGAFYDFSQMDINLIIQAKESSLKIMQKYLGDFPSEDENE